MIIDIHTHLADWRIYPMRYLEGMLPIGNASNHANVSKLIKSFLNDSDCSKMLKQMDQAGIDKSILLIIDGGIGLGEAEYTIDEIYKAHYTVLKNNPDRFIVFAGIDPRRGQYGLDLFRKGIIEYGFKGLKLYPPMGYGMDDVLLTPYIELCEQYKLPVLFHSGNSLPFMENHLAAVDRINHFASLFKNVTFILAHAAYDIDDSKHAILKAHANVYYDISGYQTILSGNNTGQIHALEKIFDEGICDRILFGTDWPLFNLMNPIQKNVEDFKSFYASVIDKKSNVDKDSLNKILFKNATKILFDN